VQNTFVTQSLLTLLIAAFVVFRFAIRELKPRVIKGGVLWIRPAILIVLTAWLAWTSVVVDPAGVGELVVALAVGGILGAITGLLIVRYTTLTPSGLPNSVTAAGSRITFGIWVAAFVVRFLARYLVPHGADPRTQLPLNSGTIALVAVAFVVIAFVFHQAIVRFGNSPGVSATETRSL
jgi:hypothetical protein